MSGIDINEIGIEKKIGQYITNNEEEKSWLNPFPPIIYYISGIKMFDDLLSNKKFAELKLYHIIAIHEHSLFFIILDDDDIIKRIGFYKHQIKNITVKHNQTIDVRDINSISKGFSTGAFGLAPAIMGSISDKLLNLAKGVTTKQKKGSIYEVIIQESDVVESKVLLSCEDDQKIDTNKFFDRYFNFNLSEDDPSEKTHRVQLIILWAILILVIIWSLWFAFSAIN